MSYFVIMSQGWERGGSVVECRTPEREVLGSRPTATVLCPWARHFTPRKYWLITQEAMAPSRHDWKIVDWDVKPQHNQPIMSQCDTTFDPKINVGHSDICFMFQWFCIYILKSIWWMNVKLWHTDSVGHISVTYISWSSDFVLFFKKTLIYMNIVLCYNEPVWHNLWSQNTCRS